MAEEIIVRQEQEEEEDEGGKSKSIDVDLVGSGGGGGGSGGGGKAARLPRWTRQEILVLIQGKRVAESRVRRGRSGMMMNNNEGEQSQSQEVVVQQVEPKWATVSSYCKRHGVNRGPVQCRKRWSNLAGDYKKIKEWEANIKDESESFWLMRNDFRRERKLPGFFDKEVFDILNTNNNTNNSSSCGGGVGAMNVADDDHVKGEAVFDSGRSAAADDGLFSDFEQVAQQRQQQRQRRREEQEQEEEIIGRSPDNEAEEGEGEGLVSSIPTAIPAPTPISEKQYQPMTAEATTGPGTNHEKQRDRGLNPETGSTSREGRKRRRFSDEDEGDGAPVQDQLVQVLEKNGRIISSQLDAYNINLKLDREERKDHATSLVAVLNKLADSLGKIADKL